MKDRTFQSLEYLASILKAHQSQKKIENPDSVPSTTSADPPFNPINTNTTSRPRLPSSTQSRKLRLNQYNDTLCIFAIAREISNEGVVLWGPVLRLGGS